MRPWFYRFCQCVLFIIFKLWNRASLHGTQHLPIDSQGFVLASNHVSYLDPPVLGGLIRRPITFLAKEKLFKMRVLGRLITWLGAWPVAADSDFRSLRSMIRLLKEGRAVVIFPEGTRQSPGDFGDPQPGVAFLAHAAKVPMVPCYIDGTDRAWPRGGRFFRPSKIRVYFGEPVTVREPEAGSDPKDRNAVYEVAAHAVMQQIKTMRGNAIKAQ